MDTRNRWHARADDEVTCIACGSSVQRTDAREYDKHGDRFDREDKRFEYVCKPCHKQFNHQPRVGLEETLAAAGAGTTDDETFFRQYFEVVTDE
jgi:formate-dependent nitrite reductase cytochrome c552 subunit